MPVLTGPDAAIKTNVLLLSQTATIYNGNITFSHHMKFTNDGKEAQLLKHQMHCYWQCQPQMSHIV